MLSWEQAKSVGNKINLSKYLLATEMWVMPFSKCREGFVILTKDFSRIKEVTKAIAKLSRLALNLHRKEVIYLYLYFCSIKRSS